MADIGGPAVHLPSRFVQYGVPRTATTLQFISMRACLCAIGHTSAQVIKAHNLSRVINQARTGAVLFVTSGKGFDSPSPYEPWQFEARELENAWKIPKGSIWYVQNVAAVAKLEWKIVTDYKEIFGLSKEQFGPVVQFMRLWDVLRRCCGPQMSLDYRMRMYGKKGYRPHLTSESVAWDACDLYDIDQVERRYMRSSLYKKCNDPHFHVSGVHLTWAKYNGSYCSRYRNAAVHEELRVNQKPRDWPDQGV